MVAGEFFGEPDPTSRTQALLSLGFESSELPPGFGSAQILMPSAHLAYEDDGDVTAVTTLLSDIERYFVLDGKDDLETFSHSSQSIGDATVAMSVMGAWGKTETLRIFESLGDKLRDWVECGGTGTFIHDEAENGGTPYKFSGSPFEGNLIMVTRSPDGKLLLDINGGDHTSPMEPSENLIAFASVLGKEQLVNYNGLPIIEVMLEPDVTVLDYVAKIAESDFLPRDPQGYVTYAETSMRVSAQDIFDWYRQILMLDPIVLDQSMVRLVSPHKFRKIVEIHTEDDVTEITGLEEDFTLDEQGQVLFSVDVILEDGKRRFYRPSFRVRAQSSNLAQEQINEMARRARLYGNNVNNRSQESIPGWSKAHVLGRMEQAEIAASS